MYLFFNYVNNLFMKRLLAFFLLLGILSVLAFYKTDSNPIFDLKAEQVCFVSEKTLKGCSGVQCGDVIFNYCSYEEAVSNLNDLEKESTAVQLYYEDLSFEVLLSFMKANVVVEEEVDGVLVYYLYSPYCKERVLVQNKFVNMQVVLKGHNLIVGMPIILTGY